MEKEANIQVITAGGPPGSAKKRRRRRKPKKDKDEAPAFNATPQKPRAAATSSYKDDPTSETTSATESRTTDSGNNAKLEKTKRPYKDDPNSKEETAKATTPSSYKDIPEVDQPSKSSNVKNAPVDTEDKKIPGDKQHQTSTEPMALEFEQSQPQLEVEDEDDFVNPAPFRSDGDKNNNHQDPLLHTTITANPSSGSGALEDLYQEPTKQSGSELFWLFACFFGIMMSFVCYGLLLEYTTSGGRKLHELSFLFVTSGLYTVTAAAGRYVRAETPTTIPPARFAVLGLTSMGSTFCSVRSLR